jgi:hypothetical protein
MNARRRPLITHLGLGDGILQTGAAVVLAERSGEIAFPCYERYSVSTRSFFANNPLISIYTLPHEAGFAWGSPPEGVWEWRIKREGMEFEKALRSGVYAGIGIDQDFSQSFYKHLNVPYEARWDACPLGEAWKRVDQLTLPGDGWPGGGKSRKIFLHDDPARGYVIHKLINRQEAFSPDFSDWNQSILRYVNLILEADEIHVIDSAFFHLVNTFAPRAKLFLHQYPRWPRPIGFRYLTRLNWRYVS